MRPEARCLKMPLDESGQSSRLRPAVSRQGELHRSRRMRSLPLAARLTGPWCKPAGTHHRSAGSNNRFCGSANGIHQRCRPSYQHARPGSRQKLARSDRQPHQSDKRRTNLGPTPAHFRLCHNPQQVLKHCYGSGQRAERKTGYAGVLYARCIQVFVMRHGVLKNSYVFTGRVAGLDLSDMGLIGFGAMNTYKNSLILAYHPT
jgi:hypothetical protein